MIAVDFFPSISSLKAGLSWAGGGVRAASLFTVAQTERECHIEKLLSKCLPEKSLPDKVFRTILFAPSSVSAARVVGHAGYAAYGIRRAAVLPLSAVLLRLPAKAPLGDRGPVPVPVVSPVFPPVEAVVAATVMSLESVTATVPARAVPVCV